MVAEMISGGNRPLVKKSGRYPSLVGPRPFLLKVSMFPEGAWCHL